MVKGGSRTPSDQMSVGKGMGLSQHYETLCTIQNLGTTDITTLMVELNKKFAWWDDPKHKAPKETCRSYLKELWRLGLVDRLDDETDDVIDLGQTTWRLAKRLKFRLSKLGKFVLTQEKKQFPYYVAWCILKAVDDGHYPQCSKLFKLCDIERKIPINDEATSEITKNHAIYVEQHAGKAIKFGWLEPCGLIYRSSLRYFTVNEDFKNFLKKKKSLDEIFSGIETQITCDELEVIPQNAFLGFSDFNKGRKYDFSFEFVNKTAKDLSLEINGKLSSVFENTSEIKIDSEKSFTLAPHSTKKVQITLTSNSYGRSDSFSTIFCGFLEVYFNSEKNQLYLPSINIGNDDRIWEINLCEKFRKIGLMAFHLGGKSDRPDAVIDLSGLDSNPEDLLSYLRDDIKEKLLMETTLGVYSGQKRIEDTQKRESDGTTKFYRHTKKVLQIKASGQLIVSDKFGTDINIHEDKRDHIISLIDHDTLNFLTEKYSESGGKKDKIIEILKLNKIITKSDINSIFAK